MVAEKEFVHLSQLIIRRGGVWFALANLKKRHATIHQVQERIRQRRRQVGGEYCIIRNGRGGYIRDLVYVFSSHNLHGTKRPRLMVYLQTERALRVLMTALRVPGIWPYGVTHSRGWTPRPERQASTHKLVTHGSREDFVRALDELSLGQGQPLPEGYPHDKVRGELVLLMERYRKERSHESSI